MSTVVVDESGPASVALMGPYRYEIGLERCETPEQVLAWVHHLCAKNWVTKKMIRDFIWQAHIRNGVKIDWNM